MLRALNRRETPRSSYEALPLFQGERVLVENEQIVERHDPERQTCVSVSF
jgi:hypothetical protein